MAAAEGRAALRGWGLAGTTAIAVASGVAAALQLMQAHFAAGGLLVLLSVAAWRWPLSIWGSACGAELSRRERRVALLVVTAVGVFFRTYRMEPPGIWGDDAINGLLAFDVLEGKITSPFQLVTHAMSNFHALTNYAVAAVFWAFGAGPATLRLPGVIAGALCVPLLYAIVAPLFGARVALVAALFLAASPMQISHSKVVLQVMFGQLFLLLGLCVLVRGVTGRRRWLIAVAGAPFALTLYTYHSAKLAPLAAVAFVLAVLWKATVPRRALLVAAAGFIMVLLLCSVPAILSYVHNPGALTQRIGGVTLWPMIRQSHSLWPLWDAVWRTLMIFHYQQGPVFHWMGIGTDPAVNVVIGFLFVHGMVQSLWRWTEPRHALLLGWVAAGLMPGLLSAEAPRVYRVFLATPAIFVWAALPIVQLYWSAATAAGARRWLLGTAALVVVAVPIIDFNYYFYRVYTDREFRTFQAERMMDMARTLKQLGRGWTGYVLAGFFDSQYETLSFLSRTWQLTMRDVGSLADVLPVHDEAEGGVLFMLDRTCVPASSLMRALYPAVELSVHTDPPPRTWWFDRWLPLAKSEDRQSPTVAFFPVSRQAADAIRGLIVTFFAADGTPITSRVDPQLLLQRQEDLPAGSVIPAQAKWAGSVYAPTDGPYTFILESNAPAKVWVDGREVVSDTRRAAAIDLAQGLHRIAADATLADTPLVRLQWQPAGAGPQVVPATLLFRDGNPHGLLAEYAGNGRRLRRVEPYPYYSFFPDTFSEVFTVRWSGRLRVPAPGGYRLETIVEGRRDLTIDGRPWQPGEPLAAGTHDFRMTLSDVHGSARVQLYWTRPAGTRELIPPEAFTPPEATG